jgi:predicted metal-dependent HD superfamily phosphohydrolase
MLPVDLGTFASNTKDYTAFNQDYRKSYFNVITSAFNQAQGEITTTRGYYKFVSEN